MARGINSLVVMILLCLIYEDNQYANHPFTFVEYTLSLSMLCWIHLKFEHAVGGGSVRDILWLVEFNKTCTDLASSMEGAGGLGPSPVLRFVLLEFY